MMFQNLVGAHERPRSSSVVIQLHHVPRILRHARWRVRFGVYNDRLWRDLPFALTLGSVLSAVGMEALPQHRVAALVILLAAAIGLVPWWRARALSRDQRAATVRWLAEEKLTDQAILFYVLFHFHKALRAALRALGHPDRGGHPASFLEFPRALTQQLFDLLGFRSPEMLLSYLRFPIDLLTAAIKRYEHAVAEERAAHESNDLERIGAAMQAVDAARSRLQSMYDRFVLTRDADLVYVGLRIVTMPGTSRAIAALAITMAHFTADGDGSPFGLTLRRALGRQGASRRCAIVLDLVDAARGHSMIDLAGLRSWHTRRCPVESYPGVRPLDAHARQQIAHVLCDLLEAKLPRASGKTCELGIVTSGYSSAVLTSLEALKGRIRFVYVIETDASHARDNRLMLARLQELQFRAAIIASDDFQRQVQRGAVQIALFGFEAINPRGDILHPRSTPHPIAMVLQAVAVPPLVVAVGERWKVCEFDAEAYDPAFVAVYEARGFTHVVTDHAAHVVSHGLNLRCCM